MYEKSKILLWLYERKNLKFEGGGAQICDHQENKIRKYFARAQLESILLITESSSAGNFPKRSHKILKSPKHQKLDFVGLIFFMILKFD